MSVCLCVIISCQQDVSKTNLLIFAEFVAYSPYIIPQVILEVINV